MLEFSWFIAFALIRGSSINVVWGSNIRRRRKIRIRKALSVFHQILFIFHFPCSFARSFNDWSSYFYTVSIFILTCHRYGIIPLVWRWSLISMQSIHPHTYARVYSKASAIELEIAQRKQIVTAGNTPSIQTIFFVALCHKNEKKKKTTVYRVKVLLLKIVWNV